jgi:asparagine synthase (glutamine-hydrolysing)
MGFGVPLADWFRGSLRELVWDHLTAPRFLERGMVNGRFVRQLLEEHQSGRRDNQQWLWSLLMLEMWALTARQGAASIACRRPATR